MRRLLCLALALLLPATARGWNDEGHELVGALAERRLGPAARAMVREILGEARLSDHDVAVWADDHRDRTNAPFHWVDIPFAEGRFEAARDCPGGLCAVARIEWARDALVREREPARRLEALRWLVHVVGDLHQPLHAAEGWRGGNRGGVRVPARAGSPPFDTNLHVVWDALVVWPVLAGRPAPEAAAALDAALTPSRLAALAAEPSPAAWAGESSRLARSVYRELGVTPASTAAVVVPQGYARAHRAEAEGRLVAAGVRLAALLDRIAEARGAPPASARPGAGGASSGEATLTLLHFNDVYEVEPLEAGRVGGLARVATLVRQLRAEGRAVLTTLGGDFLSPSALGLAEVAVDGERAAPLHGRQMVAVLDALGLDWATVGNHEFDVGEASFRARLRQARFRLVVSNAAFADGSPFPGAVPSAVVPVEAGGRTLRLGLLGLVLDANKVPWVRYQPPVEAARREVARLRAAGVDAVVALTHLPVEADEALLDAVPELDLVLGGHEHERACLRCGTGRPPVVKADANVRTVQLAELRFGAPGARPAVAVTTRPVDAALPADGAVAAEAARWVALGMAAYRARGLDPGAVVATTRVALDGREGPVRSEAGPLTALVAGAIRCAAPGSEAALFNGGAIRIDDVLPAGALLTQYDVVRLLPFGGKVRRVALDGATLARVLDAGVRNRGTGGFLHASGVTRDAQGWRIGGLPLAPERRYLTAMNDFLLSGRERGLAFLGPCPEGAAAAPGSCVPAAEVSGAADLWQAVMAELREPRCSGP